METHSRNQIGRNDNRAILWTVVALVVVAVLAYIAYAAYRDDNYAIQTGTQNTVTGTPTTNPNTMNP